LSRLEQLSILYPPEILKVDASQSPRIGVTPPVGITQVEITSRIMRNENYMIGLFTNESVLNLNVPLPLIGSTISPFLTLILQWNIEFCVLGLILSDSLLWQKSWENPSMRAELATKLRHGFILMAIFNAIFSPIIGIFLLSYFFLRYGDVRLICIPLSIERIQVKSINFL
jgi:autophagy-related protein 9